MVFGAHVTCSTLLFKCSNAYLPNQTVSNSEDRGQMVHRYCSFNTCYSLAQGLYRHLCLFIIKCSVGPGMMVHAYNLSNSGGRRRRFMRDQTGIKIKEGEGWGSGVAQVLEHLPSKHKALSSSPSTTPLKKKCPQHLLAGCCASCSGHNSKEGLINRVCIA
jgi:hypothetical protein